jgi:hypothetical protein
MSEGLSNQELAELRDVADQLRCPLPRSALLQWLPRPGHYLTGRARRPNLVTSVAARPAAGWSSTDTSSRSPTSPAGRDSSRWPPSVTWLSVLLDEGIIPCR